MRVRLLSFVMWAAVAASAVFWLLRLGPTSPAAPSYTVAVAAPAAPRGDLTRVLGAAPVRPVVGAAAPVASALSSRFKLVGVAAPRQGGDQVGLALIAVDGKPARSYAVGASVDGDLLLQAVHSRGARLGARDAAAQVTLELPALPPPATASFPPMPAPGLPGAGVTASPPVLVPAPGTVPTEVQAGEPVALPAVPSGNTR